MSRCFDTFSEAESFFYEIKKHHEYVCLLYSHHEYSEGYWVEFERPINLFGTIIDIHDIVDIRDNKIKEILNEEEDKNISI